jgi:hypothetical protein
MLGIPIPVHEGSFSHIKKNSDKAAMLKEASLLIWDEAAMQHRHAVEAIDRTLRDFLDQPDLPFGGITVAFGGDFQQTLPVVPKGSKEEIVGACLQRSFLWPKIKVLHLTENMRVDRNDPQSARFAEWLQNVGQGKDLPLDHTFSIPPHMVCGPQISDMTREIYPGIRNAVPAQDQYFLERAILCPRNTEVNEINSEVLREFPGDAQVFHCADSVKGSDDADQYPMEYLNSIESGSLPPARLEVKPGVPLMLLRNLDQKQGLCNGTRLRLVQMRNRVLEVRIITGPCAGNTAFIPRITISPSEGELPFELHRRQFPVRLAFAMTINKAQGQSLGTVGLDLRYAVFGHGQFYVGVSRGTNWNRVKVLLEEGLETTNIVYKDVLLRAP